MRGGPIIRAACRSRAATTTDERAGTDERPGERHGPAGLYLHVPFCVSRCPYCDFVVYAGSAARGPRRQIETFVEALTQELLLRADLLEVQGRAAPLTSVYVGGGTPSLLSAAQIGSLLELVDRRFGIAEGAEITVEANPGRDELGDLAGMRAAGVTRLSLGAQSGDPIELRTLGRRHGPEAIGQAIESARRAGIASVSIDLLYDTPGQTAASWAATLEMVLGFGVEHVSAYALSLEDEDPGGWIDDRLPVAAGARRWRERARRMQDEDRAADLYAMADQAFTEAGLTWYEVSNWARPGRTSRHNLGYWMGLPYEAVGPGAHAFDGRRERRWNGPRLDHYLAALAPPDGTPPSLPPGGVERLDETQAAAEMVILPLRTRWGIDARTARETRFAEPLAWAEQHGLVEWVELAEGPGVGGPDPAAWAPARCRLTRRGRLLANEVFMRCLPSRAAH